nr:immunoglobulin light chain junction region [Macaca mulatta]
CQQHNPYPLTF